MIFELSVYDQNNEIIKYQLPNKFSYIKSELNDIKILFKNNYNSLTEVKNKIDDDNIKNKWDKVKKLGNPFELVHMITPKNKWNNSVCALNPISRSFFKLIEILDINNFNLIYDNFQCKNIACIAEGPGGFIEGFYYLYGNKINSINGLTLYSENKYVPGWSKMNNLLDKNENFFKITKLHYGNLYKLDDIIKFKNNIKNKVDFATADGGLDFSIDFNNQETMSNKIIYSEILCALNILNKNGNFIIKFFDIFGLFSINMMYILYCLFDKITIIKPKSSRPANSEKYIYCKGFIGISDELLNNMNNILKEWDNMDDNNTISYFSLDIPSLFVHKMNEINTNLLNNQIFYLNKTIDLINNYPEKEQIEKISNEQSKNAINWCLDLNLPINGGSKYLKNYLSNNKRFNIKNKKNEHNNSPSPSYYPKTYE